MNQSIMSSDQDRSLESVVGDLLRARGLTLATAESCTGGTIGALLTSISGSSDYYRGGVICYHNDLKVGLLGIEEETLLQHGAVSEPVAYQMAAGVRKVTSSDLGLSATGIAGPRGAVAGKPVGLVFLGLSSASETRVERLDLSGDRKTIQLEAARIGLDWLRRYLQ